MMGSSKDVHLHNLYACSISMLVFNYVLTCTVPYNMHVGVLPYAHEKDSVL